MGIILSVIALLTLTTTGLLSRVAHNLVRHLLSSALHPARHGRFARRAATGTNRSTVVIVVLSLPAAASSRDGSGTWVLITSRLASGEPVLVAVLAGSIGATQSGTSLAGASESVASEVGTALARILLGVSTPAASIVSALFPFALVALAHGLVPLSSGAGVVVAHAASLLTSRPAGGFHVVKLSEWMVYKMCEWFEG